MINASTRPIDDDVTPPKKGGAATGEIQSQRKRLAQMIGRLLARHWLRIQGDDQAQVEHANRNDDSGDE